MKGQRRGRQKKRWEDKIKEVSCGAPTTLQEYVIGQNRIEVKLYVTHLTFETLSSTYKGGKFSVAVGAM